MSDPTINIDGVTYKWFGGPGCVIRSRERGVKNGDVRMIRDELFYAIVYPLAWPCKSEVCWVSVFEDEHCIEYIRNFKRKLFDCGGCEE